MLRRVEFAEDKAIKKGQEARRLAGSRGLASKWF